MRLALVQLGGHRRSAALTGVAAVPCVAALAAGRALAPDASGISTEPPSVAAQDALGRLDAGVDPLAQATRQAKAAVAEARAALADDSTRRPTLLAQARERAVRARLTLLALTDGSSDDERRAIGEANRALQRLVLELDTAR